MPGKGLNAQIKRFCEYYIVNLNGAKSAVAAGYSKKSAREIAYQILQRPIVQDYIATLKEEWAQRNKINADLVIAELTKIATSNVQDFVSRGNQITDVSKLSRFTAAAVKSVRRTVTETGSGKDKQTKVTVQIEAHDKVAALEKLGRHLGIFEADNKQKKAVINVNVGEDDD